ncbi:hypothetical protein ACKWTF_009270 [Chironomus riparius]
MERKTRSGKVIVEIKSPAKRGRKKKSDISESSSSEQIQQQVVRRSSRGKPQSDTSSSQLDVSVLESSNLSTALIEESTESSISDTQNIQESSKQNEFTSKEEKMDNFNENEEKKAEVAIKCLEIKLIDCCLHEKVNKSTEKDKKLQEQVQSEDVEMIEIKEEVIDSSNIEQKQLEEVPQVQTSSIDENEPEISVVSVEIEAINPKQADEEPIQIKEEPQENSETITIIDNSSNDNLEKMDVQEVSLIESKDEDIKIENIEVNLTLNDTENAEIKEADVVPKVISEPETNVVKEEAKPIEELEEFSFLRRSRRLKSIYMETPVIKTEDIVMAKENALIAQEAAKLKARNKKLAEMEAEEILKKSNDSVQIKDDEMKGIEGSQVIKQEPVIIPESFDVKQCDERLSQFITIKDNIYMKSSDKVICKVNKTMKCDCTMTEEDLKNGEMGCRYNCINRLLFIECSSKCRCGEFCDNQQFQRYNYSPVSVFRTEKKGFGIRADDDIPPETFIIEYVGEVLNNKQFDKRAKKYSKDKNRHYYFMALRSNAVIDATVKGNISRFINHSCDPNAMTQKWTVNGELRVGFFSIRDIRRGEEITFDYQFQRYGKEAQKCYCESENCRGWIGENPESEEELEIEIDDSKAKKGKPKKVIVKKGKVKAEKSEIDEQEPIKEDEIDEPVSEEKEEIKKEVVKIVRKVKKRQDPLEDLEIEEEINDLTNLGLKNRAHTIRLARLIVRAKNTDARSRLLQILISGEFPCRRLFLDYNGLRLLHSWMCDISIKSSIPDIYLCIELMSALDLLPITNKTVLRDSKILERVEKWRNIDLEKKKLSKEEKKQAKADKKKNKAASKFQQDTSIEQKSEESIFIRTFDVLEELPTTKLLLKETASELLRKWEVLKEDFRIPKKQKQEIMIEHEREAGMEEWQEINKIDSIDNDRYKNRFGEDSFTANNNKNFNSSYKKTIGPVERQQRRQMYAMKVAQEELETRMATLHDNNCALFGLPTNTHPMMVPVRVNRVTGEYCNLMGQTVPVPPNHHNFKYEPLTLSTNTEDYHLPPIDLPDHWKYAIDKFGRIYYYHEKIRQPQWEAPIKLLPLHVNSDDEYDYELDSDESETETEDEEEEELKELLAMLKKKKQLMQSQSTNLPSNDMITEEEDLEKKIMNNMLSNPPDQAIKLSQLPAKKCLKKKSRRGLSTMKFIRPRTEEDKLYGRTETKRYKEVKEKLRRDKKRRMLLGEQHAEHSGDEDEEDSSLNEASLAKIVDELDIINKSKQLDKMRKIKKEAEVIKKKESPIDPSKLKKPAKPVPQISPADQLIIKKQFRDEIKEEIMKYLLPYRDDACIIGKITSVEDYNSLVHKLTFSVLTKESKHCAQSNSILKATDSVKGKTKEYIKKYMAKFEGSYQRKSDEQDYESILSKLQ